jgi:hypothetical protein
MRLIDAADPRALALPSTAPRAETVCASSWLFAQALAQRTREIAGSRPEEAERAAHATVKDGDRGRSATCSRRWSLAMITLRRA